MRPGECPVNQDETTLLEHCQRLFDSLEYVMPFALMPPAHWDLWACDKIEPIEETL